MRPVSLDTGERSKEFFPRVVVHSGELPVLLTRKQQDAPGIYRCRLGRIIFHRWDHSFEVWDYDAEQGDTQSVHCIGV